MRINDPLHGEADITEDILVELLQSKPLQRLKNVQQLGPPQRYYPVSHFSRYEHSVGVMLLLRNLGASVEEQVAGLLHDVAHTAFSHVGDWVFGRVETEDYHDDYAEHFILNTEIAEILESYGLDVAHVMDPDTYPLLERAAPSLCADRIDYALRECEGWASPGLAKEVLPDLVAVDGQIAFRTQEVAKRFGTAFLRLQREHWGHPEFVVRYALFSDALKRAMTIGIITRKDFYGDDDHLIEILEGSDDTTIRSLLERLKRGPSYIRDEADPDIDIRKKFRHVDPDVVVDDGTVPLSQIDEEYRQLLEQEREHNKKGIRVRLQT